MPRWDQSDPDYRPAIVEALGEEAEDDYAVDVCSSCDRQQPRSLGDLLHPPYEETDYECEICGRPLTAEDD